MGQIYAAVACCTFTRKDGRHSPDRWVVVSYVDNLKSQTDVTVTVGLNVDKQTAINQCFSQYLDDYKKCKPRYNFNFLLYALTKQINDIAHMNSAKGTFELKPKSNHIRGFRPEELW